LPRQCDLSLPGFYLVGIQNPLSSALDVQAEARTYLGILFDGDGCCYLVGAARVVLLGILSMRT